MGETRRSRSRRQVDKETRRQRTDGDDKDREGERMKIQRHELEVYKKAFATAMLIFQATKAFPSEETYSLTDRIRRSSRSVCANLAEAWRKRRYKAAFISKLSDARRRRS